jgi:HEAT repeat protein
MSLWESFRAYTRSSEIRELRYVGFPLAKKEPPTLEIEEVFVPLETQVRRARLLPDRKAELKAVRQQSAGGVDNTELRAAPFGREAPEEPSVPEPFAKVLSGQRGIVVLGDPGSGKTTLLRWLAVTAARGRLAMSAKLSWAERLLPLPVSVGALADIRRDLGIASSVPDALARYFHGRNVGDEGELRGFLTKALEGGDCLVLLDGLDEVRSAERDEIRAWLETFAMQYGRNRFVATSRHVGFAGFTLADGVVATLLPFTDEQVRRYVESFTRAYRRWETRWPDAAAETRESAQLLQAIRQNPRLAALGRSPFLLSALALIHRAEGRLPRHRVQFYAIVARTLCETWGTARRIVAKTSEPVIAFEEEAVPILGNLARAMHEAYPDGVAPERFVLDTLAQALVERRGMAPAEADAVARQFLRRAGEETQILLERGPGHWGFLHLTFQEFFTAVGLHAAEQFEEQALRHLYDPRWEEVLRLGVGYLALVQNRPEAARRFVDKVLHHRETGAREPLNVLPRKHEALAALLAAEAGEALPPGLQREIAETFVRWLLDVPGEVPDRIARELALTEFRELLIPLLRDSLKAMDWWVRVEAVLALGALHAEVAIPALVEALKGDDQHVRAAAAATLAALRAESAAPALIEALRDKEDVRAQAAGALGLLEIQAAVPALIEALENSRVFIGMFAAWALGKLNASAAVPALIKALEDDKDRIRPEVAAALVSIGGDLAVQEFLKGLTDKEAVVRARAAWVLGNADVVEAVPALLQRMNDEDPSVRREAARALGKLGARAAVPVLIQALSDEDWGVRAFAVRSLHTLHAEGAVPLLLHALDDQAAAVRAWAAVGLGELAAHAAVPALLNALQDRHRFVRSDAARALGMLGAKVAVPALLQALKDEDDSVRAEAAKALGTLRAEVAVPALVDALKDTKYTVRVEAARALGAFGAVAPIRPLVDYANQQVGGDLERVVAVQSLFRIAESS